MFWMTAFVDLAPDEFERGVEFWRGVTGYALSPARGEHDEFATLVPPDGDAHLRVQRLGDGPSRLHLDVHVADPSAAAEDAVALGATVIARPDLGYVVMSSPGGFTFCFVAHEAGARRAADRVGWRSPVGRRPGVPRRPGAGVRDRARVLAGTDRLGGAGDPRTPRVPPADPPGSTCRCSSWCSGWTNRRVRCARTSTSPPATSRPRSSGTARSGATVAWFGDGWVVMTAPAGPAYCITGRSPGMRVLDVPDSR